MESILTSIKKLLGISEEDKHFDGDLIIHINSVLSALTQLGVGDEKGFSISGDSEKWSDFMGDDARLSLVKSLVHLQVRMLFDPPLSSAVAEAMKRSIDELQWRVTIVTDGTAINESEGNQNG